MTDSPKLRASIIVISDTASTNPSTDKCIPALQEVFANEGGGRFDASDTTIVSDDVLEIQRTITERTDREDFRNLIVTSGGTGFTVKDVTPEVSMLRDILDRTVSLGNCRIGRCDELSKACTDCN